MKFTFIIPPVLEGTREVERVFGCTYGLYSIPNIFMLYNAAVVRQKGQSTSFIDAPAWKWNKGRFVKYIKHAQDEVFVFYTVNLAKENDLAAVDVIRQHRPASWIIFMGPAPTYEPNEYLNKEKNIVIRGEAENTIAELATILSCEAEDVGQKLQLCNGISYRLDRAIKHNPARETISCINTIPFPARDLLHKNRKKYFNPKLGIIPFTPLLTSRGCSFRCRYCVPNSLSFTRELEFRKVLGGWHKPKVAVRSFENVYDELLLLKKDGYKAISILDDQFIWEGEREIKIAQAMGELGFSWGCLSRGDVITEEIARIFGRNNCKYVDVGIESFCQDILNDIRKGTTVEKQCRGIGLLKKYNIPVKLNILLGSSPLETRHTIEHTISTANKLSPSSIMVGICNPFPGTEFWEISKKQGWLLTSEYRPVDVQKESTIGYSNLGKKELEEAVRKANLSFFISPEFIIRNVAKIKNPIRLVKAGRSIFKKLTNP